MNDRNPLVSCVITTHNRCELVKRAVLSVKNQTYLNKEIIIIDDASTDGTYQWGSELTEADTKYIYITPNESKGNNYARNIGISNAKGDYIAFLDDDDYWQETKIEKQIQVVKNNSEIGMVYTGIIANYGCKLYNYKKLPNKNICGDMLEKKMYLWPYFNTSQIMVKKQILENVGNFDEKLKYWQEYELFLRIMQVTKVGLVNEPLVYIDKRIGEATRLTNKFESWIEAVCYINEKHGELFNKLSISEQVLRKEYFYKEAAYRAFFSSGKTKMIHYYKKAYQMNPKLEYFIRICFRLSRKDTLLIEGFIMKIKYKLDLLKQNLL